MIKLTSAAPWILLFAVVDYESFIQQVMVACNADARGIAVGRAVWKEAVTMSGEDRTSFLRTIAKYRLSWLTSLCHALAKPWTDFYTTDAPFDWKKAY